MKLRVGVHAGSYSGIDTYAEQIAIAGATVGCEVTLLATDREVGKRLEARLGGGIRIEHLGLPVLSSGAALLERLWPTAAVRRMLSAMRADAARAPRGDTVWHLNRPALALAVGHGEQVGVAGWFYPHRAWGRVHETWRHVGGAPLRRAIIAGKALDFYRWDQAGYAAADWIVTPTELLAEQLRTQGLRALACPPPASVPGDLAAAERSPGSPLRFLVCSGDLGHPRKNLLEAVAALAELAGRHGPVTLTAIGRNPEMLQGFASRHAAQVRVEALGTLEPARVREVMQACDALLFPSRYEEWGYVAVESLLCGTPVVTYPVYPFGEMLSGGLGVVAEGLGPSKFAAAIERSLLLPRGRDLSNAANARFGSAAIGERLAPLWRSRGKSRTDGLGVLVP